MRKLIAIAGFILNFWIFVSLPSPAAAQTLGNARLSLIQGDVSIQSKDTGTEWGAAAINTPLTQGTKLWVSENGKAEVQFLGGSYLRAAENTNVDFTDLRTDNQGDIIQVGVPQGRTYIYYAGPAGQNSVFQVDTPIASARAYGASKFKVDAYQGGYTEVSVLSGDVYVESRDGNMKIDPGSMLSIGTDRNAGLSPIRQADSWDRWNQSRDSALAQVGPSRKYLPSTFSVYSSDFDTYGRWVSTPDYGYVWTPFRVAGDWAPYRIGRWCWIGGDYVWVSYEPWGWVPYHYGRWAFVGSIGWCWVPPPIPAFYWGPGFVAWISTPTYVSWVPLAPGEIYYGRGYYGPHSVSITNININKINITNVYVNAQVVNAVTVMNRRTFLTGRTERLVDAPRNPFTAGVKPSIGRPDIKPERATALPNPAKALSQRELPSREIATRAAEMKNRPVVVHKDISGLKPGQRVTSMRVDRSERPKPVMQAQEYESRQPPVQRREVSKTRAKEREVAPPPAQRGQPGGPPTQREFGIAPPHKGESTTPPARKEPINRPSASNKVTPQTKGAKSATPEREQMGTPPVQRREVAPSPAQGGQPRGPSTQREFGVAPPRRGESGASSARRAQTGNPAAQREMGVAPSFKGERGNLALKPAPQRQISPPSQPHGGTSAASHGQRKEKRKLADT
jgi:hypothetical protein